MRMRKIFFFFLNCIFRPLFFWETETYLFFLVLGIQSESINLYTYKMLATYYCILWGSWSHYILWRWSNILTSPSCKILDLWRFITKWRPCLWTCSNCLCGKSMGKKSVTKCGPNCQKRFQFHPTNAELSLKTKLTINLLHWINSDFFVNLVHIFVTFLIT